MKPPLSPDPNANPRLAAALQKAKEGGVPKSGIEMVLARVRLLCSIPLIFSSFVIQYTRYIPMWTTIKGRDEMLIDWGRKNIADHQARAAADGSGVAMMYEAVAAGGKAALIMYVNLAWLAPSRSLFPQYSLPPMAVWSEGCLNSESGTDV